MDKREMTETERAIVAYVTERAARHRREWPRGEYCWPAEECEAIATAIEEGWCAK